MRTQTYTILYFNNLTVYRVWPWRGLHGRPFISRLRKFKSNMNTYYIKQNKKNHIWTLIIFFLFLLLIFNGKIDNFNVETPSFGFIMRNCCTGDGSWPSTVRRDDETWVSVSYCLLVIHPSFLLQTLHCSWLHSSESESPR